MPVASSIITALVMNNGLPQQSNIDALTAAASAGDKKAYEALYRDFYPKISRFVYYRVNHKETAEDLVAEIFIKAWDGLRASSEISSFTSWIFTIARNKVIDHYRTRKSVTDLFELENVLEYEDNVVDAIDLTIQSKAFLRSMEQLSPDQQHVLRLKFFDGLENEEIAAVLDKTPGTIRVIQHRAISALRRLTISSAEAKEENSNE